MRGQKENGVEISMLIRSKSEIIRNLFSPLLSIITENVHLARRFMLGQRRIAGHDQFVDALSMVLVTAHNIIFLGNGGQWRLQEPI